MSHVFGHANVTLLPLLCALLLYTALAPSGARAGLRFGKPAAPRQRTAGILYEVWHAPAAALMAQVKAKGGEQLTTETVIRANGARTLNDVYVKHGLNGDIWNVEPALGFYCLYTARTKDPSPPQPDCANVEEVAEAHARMLVDAGFDYVAVDVTNWPDGSTPATDLSVLRPTEVLFEQWYALRQRGVKTPSIAVWPCADESVPQAKATYQLMLDRLYNNATYSDLVYRDEDTNKKVMFAPSPTPTSHCLTPAIQSLMESNGGRNDVVVRRMWALYGQDVYKTGTWGFFSPCVAADGTYTTSMVGEADCNQPPTLDPQTGQTVEISASGAYMLAQCSLPFASPGKMRGLTVQRLFKRILAESPRHVFMSSFNEHIGGRQAPYRTPKTGFNMGLPNDPQKDQVWVDTYAHEFSRDMEPTVEGGSRVWEVASSCLKMYKEGVTCETQPDAACCTTADKEVFGNVWALRRDDGNDYLLTASAAERDVLKTRGWSELCTPFEGPSVFCVDGAETDGRTGPFMLYTVPDGDSTKALYRCIDPTTVQHFFSLDPACEGLGTMESLLGHIAAHRGGEMLRGLYRCKGAGAGVRLHTLDLGCDTFDAPDVLGYVR